MTLRIPSVGTAADLASITSADLTLRLYTNNVLDGLDESEVLALTSGDFNEATFDGYSAEELDPGDWTVTPGNPSVAEHEQKEFVSDDDQDQQTVWGYYVTDDDNGDELRWFEQFGPAVVEFDGDEIRVTVRRTQEDTVSAQ